MAGNVLTQLQHQLAAASIRSRAGRCGVAWCVWSTAQDDMKSLGVEEVDVRHALQNCWVNSVEVVGGVNRFVAAGQDADGRLLEVKCLICDDPLALEVFTVRLL